MGTFSLLKIYLLTKEKYRVKSTKNLIYLQKKDYRESKSILGYNFVKHLVIVVEWYNTAYNLRKSLLSSLLVFLLNHQVETDEVNKI